MGIGTGAIRAGRAFVELLADPTPLIQGLNKAKARLSAFASEVGKPALLAGGAVFAPMAKFFTDAVKYGNDLELLAQRYGTTTTKIHEIKSAFAAAGADGDEFAGVLTGLADKLRAAADSRDELVHGLTGLRGDVLIGQGIDRQLDMIAEKLRGIYRAGNFQDFDSVVRELGLEKLAPYLAKGKAGLDELRAAGRGAFAALDPEQAKQGRDIMVAWQQATLAAKSVLIELGAALLPTGEKLTKYRKDLMETVKSVREWIKEHKTAVVLVTVIGGLLVTVGAGVMAFAAAVKALTAAVVAYNAVTRISIVLDAIKWAKGNPAAAAGAVLAIGGVLASAYLLLEEYDAKDKKLREAGGGKPPNALFEGGRLERDRPRVGPVVQMLYEAQRGTFGGPIQQQLGYGENVAQRQLDIAQGIAQDAADIAQGVRDMDAKIGGLVNAFQVR